MRKLVAVLFTAALAMPAFAQQCRTIQDGGLFATRGNPISVGYDVFG
jgi:hypothetical protein